MGWGKSIVATDDCTVEEEAVLVEKLWNES